MSAACAESHSPNEYGQCDDCRAWLVTVGSLRKALEGVPDDTPVNVTMVPVDGAEATDRRPVDALYDPQGEIFDLFIDV